jgi:hypothetical protein
MLVDKLDKRPGVLQPLNSVPIVNAGDGKSKTENQKNRKSKTANEKWKMKKRKIKVKKSKWENQNKKSRVSGVFAWLYVHLAYKYELADPCCHTIFNVTA